MSREQFRFENAQSDTFGEFTNYAMGCSLLARKYTLVDILNQK